MSIQTRNGNSSLSRKVTAMGTTGEFGQLFTVYEKNWNCPDCGQENYASRPKCFRCRHSKPSGDQNLILDPALQALKEGKEIEWQEAIDPNTYQVYYYNKVTNETQWERPIELGPTPMATGWFGRGAAGSNAVKHFAELNRKFLSRPARKQKEFIDSRKSIQENGSDFNIWYGRYLDDYNDQGVNKEPAPDRCNLEKDAGYTRADAIELSNTGKSTNKRKDRRFFCLHFARGMCAKGSDCIFYHRIPTQEDDAKCDELFDCFGRSRHSKHRDDMNGVGSFMKPCRTLYVGNLLKSKYETSKALDDALWKHFSEWGELENCNVVHRLSIAFPRYRFRTSAEFAKEAMSNQALEHGEILQIRWAFDDPNPVAQDAIDRADKDAIVSLLHNKGISLDQPSENVYDETSNKRYRIEGPNGPVDYTEEQYIQYYQQYYAQYGLLQYPSQSPDTSNTSDNAVESAAIIASNSSKETTSKSSEWSEHVDEDTGATYYYNNSTGESSWSPPEDN
mmetsp:Transcript_17692/g.15963  ORF Transcript_17692/g.15963 Transcript_17692/m.15963 type:complete len:506 (+) Transcript_17692:488-2005(+)